MAKLSSINKNNKRINLSDKLYKKRQALKKIIMDKSITQLKNNQELEIHRTYNTMNAFLPFIIAYNLNNYA